MRLLEGVLVVGQLLGVDRWTQVAITLVHSWKEGRRWQMIPSYIALLVPRHYSWLRIALASVSGFLSLAVPVFKLPSLKGSYSISSRIYEWIDETRPEWSLYGDQSGKRRILVRVWYPTDYRHQNPNNDYKAVTAPYMNFWDIRARYFAKSKGMPASLLSHFSLVRSNSLLHPAVGGMIPIANQQSHYPLILFSHGYMSSHDMNTVLIEQMTSLGCIVASIEHTYDSIFSYLPESNQTIEFNASPPEGLEGEAFWEFRRHHLEIRTKDLQFMMDRMLDSVEFGPFIDRDRIIAMGHSFGGGTAVNSLASIPQVRLAVGLDAYLAVLDSGLKTRGIDKPMLLFQAGPRFYAYQHFWAESNDRDAEGMVQRSPKSLLVRIDGATHTDFIDLPFFTSRWLSSLIGMTGPLSGQEMLDLILGYTVEFLRDNGILNNDDGGGGGLQIAVPAYPCVSINSQSDKDDGVNYNSRFSSSSSSSSSSEGFVKV